VDLSDSLGKRRLEQKDNIFQKIDFNQCPFIVLWELTRACDLACKHCRADAIPFRNPHELTTGEAFALLDEIRKFHASLPIILVLTGGDPLKRSDIYDIIQYASHLGLRTTITPSGTPTVKLTDLIKMKLGGLSRVAISLDGSIPRIHNQFRGVAGSFAWSLQILKWARQCELEAQVNTSITRHNVFDFINLAHLCSFLEIVLWSVFFLVPTGRGSLKDAISAEEFEQIFEKMEELTHNVSFDIKSTAAPQYRRVVIQKRILEGKVPGRGLSEITIQAAKDGKRAMKNINDANGVVFISHTGEVYPSGFLPLSAGNVRKESLVDIYRESPLFCSLRDYSQLKGKCGACEFRSICGGSRARAYAIYGDYLANDPFCVHIPKTYQGVYDIAKENGEIITCQEGLI